MWSCCYKRLFCDMYRLVVTFDLVPQPDNKCIDIGSSPSSSELNLTSGEKN